MVVGFTTTCAISGYQQYFSYMVVVSFIGGGNLSTQRKPPICRNHLQEEIEDAKGVIIICKSKQNRQHNGQKKKNTRTNKDLQKIHRKLKIEQHEPLGVNSCTPAGLAVPAPLVTPVVLLE